MKELVLILLAFGVSQAYRMPTTRQRSNLSQEALDFTSDVTTDIGLHMAASIFGIPPSRKVFIDFIYNTTVKFLCLDAQDQKELYTVYFEMRPKEGPIKAKLLNSEFVSKEEIGLLRDALNKFYILKNLTEAVNYIKVEKPEFGEKVEQAIETLKKQYEGLSEDGKRFSKEIFELYFTVAQRDFPAASTLSEDEKEKLLNKIIRKYKGLPFETRVEVLKAYTLQYGEELLNHTYDALFTSKGSEDTFPF